VTRTLVTAVATAAVASWTPVAVHGEASVSITVQELIQRDHQLKVPVGTEVLWRDPHFERVWFPPGAGAPRVEKAEVGFKAVFTKPGTYRGRFTIVGGHRSDDVYPLIVTVTER
jgi:hypothetical protein